MRLCLEEFCPTVSLFTRIALRTRRKDGEYPEVEIWNLAVAADADNGLW